VDTDAPRPTLVDLTAPRMSSRPCGAACIVQIYGRELGRRVDLGASEFVFGRDEDCGLQLDDHTVSRRHAAVRRDARGFVLHDMQSTNGTFVNNVAVTEHLLVPGDEIKIGQTIYKFLSAQSTEAQYHQVIYRLMTRDGLTESHNRAAFDQVLVRELSRAQRYQRPLGLVLFDIDRFKSVNDRFGHMAGDDVLRQLGQRVAHAVRQEDFFARYGGEEFAIIVPEGTRESCRLLAERVRQVIADRPFDLDGAEHTITCSFGVAELDRDNDKTGEALVRGADQRLYEAKDAGRNCVKA
jgi:diguanylate cyclase (GGDEF)-like protein